MRKPGLSISKYMVLRMVEYILNNNFEKFLS